MTDLHPRDIQAIDAAKLYYSGMTQAEVAERLHVARPTVSKLLTHAERRGFVRISVIDPREHDENLVSTLVSRYGLLDLILVSPARPDPETLRHALGKAGAALLRRLVRDGDTIGVVPSRTTSVLASYLEPAPLHGVTVVQVSNGLSVQAGRRGTLIVLQRLAAPLGARCLALETPPFLESVEAHNVTRHLPHIKAVLDQALATRIVLYAVGDIESNRALLEASPMSDEEREILYSRSVGDICSRFIDARGRICLPDFNNRTIGLSLPDLRTKEQKILVAGGPEKVDAIHAALRNSYVNRLVTDVETARAIVARET